MKKIIPLLLTLPLLAACGNNVKVVKPSFAEKGTEKTYAEILEAVSKASEEAAINKEELLPSAVLASNYAKLNVSEYKRADKAISTSKEGWTTEYKMSIDMDNVFSQTVGESTYFKEEKSASTKNNEKTVYTEKTGYQELKGAEKTYLINVDEQEKTYNKASEVPEDKTTKEILDQAVRYSVNSASGEFQSVIMSLYGAPEATLSKYKFWQNEKVFTIEFEDKIENDEVKDLAGDVVTVTNRTTEKIWQVDLTDGKMSAKTYKHIVTEVKHQKEHSNMYAQVWAKGDVETSDSEEAEVVTYEYSSSIKAKKADISKFTPLFEVK